MPKPKKQKKSEQFIPINPEDVKLKVEVPVKEIREEDLITIEKPGKTIAGKKTKKMKIELRTRSIREDVEKNDSEETNKKLKSKYTLIITEKPQAALKIANALGKARKYSENFVPYYYLERDGKKIIVACAVGHLLNLSGIGKGYPIFETEWLANFKSKKQDWSKKYYNLLVKLCKNANEFIIASVDYNEPTPILENGEFKILKIGELVDEIIKGKRDKKDFKVPSFDLKGRIKFSPLKDAIRHFTREDLYEILLDYGRKIRLSSSHNVFTIKDNKIINKKTTDLKKGDRILCPGFLPNPKNFITELDILELIRNEKSREIFVSGHDVAEIIKQRRFNKKRKEHYLNDDRILLTPKGISIIINKRKKLKYSTFHVGKKAGISQSLIVQWENKKKNPSLANFKRYLKKIKLNTKAFLTNNLYCTLMKSSFNNVLESNYKNQFRNFSNFTRAIIPLSSITKKEKPMIKSGFIYGSKNRRNKLPIRILINKEFVQLMGYYLAEGDLNNQYRVRFSLGLKEYGHEQKIINEIKAFCSFHNIDCHYYLHNRIKHQILTIDNSVLASLLNNLGFGNGARNKRIPSLVFNLPPDLKKEFLRAYFLGDGSISDSNISFNTSSENLASDVVYLLLQLGIIASIYKVQNSGKSELPSWHVVVSNSSDLNKIENVWLEHHLSKKLKISSKKMKKRKLVPFGDLNLIGIKNIKKIKPTKNYVYDLSVKGENFIAGNGGICCHNTDYDIEGEVIGWNIIRFIAKQKDAKRMKYSTLTTDELNEAYKNLMPTIDWSQAYAGETRHILDWLYGINLSRALMEAIKKAGSFRIMSIGRVQGPALNFIVEKELEIQKFQSSLYWQVFIKLKNHKPELKYEKDIIKKADLSEFENLEGKKGIAHTEKTKRNISPPTPFDLTSLQREAYRLFKINPAKTLQLAQSLYLAGLISYPRTSSQKIPESIKPREILKKLAKNFPIVELAIRDKPIEGKKSDPAHPSIFPTAEFGDMNADESKIYSLIVKRFISCFCEDAEIESKKITFLCENKKFSASGIQILKNGWMKVYPLAMQETDIEDIEGEKTIEKKRIEEKTTQPPRRYSPASIITELEKKGIGTKSTRSSIIETLYNRKYIEGESIQATPLGISLISTLKKYSPIIIEEKLTRNFEKEMNEIQKAKKGLKEKQEKVLEEAKETISKIANDFKKKEEKIGKELIKANKENYERERENNTLSLCEKCKKGKLRILFNRKSFRYFVACNNYPECKNTYSLPPNALIKPSGKMCECGFPKLLAIRKATRPWEFCFNEKNHPNRFFSGQENSDKK